MLDFTMNGEVQKHRKQLAAFALDNVMLSSPYPELTLTETDSRRQVHPSYASLHAL
jgi:hypothetical protein